MSSLNPLKRSKRLGSVGHVDLNILANLKIIVQKRLLKGMLCWGVAGGKVTRKLKCPQQHVNLAWLSLPITSKV
jgi:hypothetical protein